MLLCVCIYAFSNPNAVDSSIFLQINNIVVAHWISAAAATAIIYIAIQSQQFFAFYWKNKVEQRISLSISFPNTRVFCHLNRMKTDAVTLIIPNANAIFCFFNTQQLAFICVKLMSNRRLDWKLTPISFTLWVLSFSSHTVYLCLCNCTSRCCKLSAVWWWIGMAM